MVLIRDLQITATYAMGPRESTRWEPENRGACVQEQLSTAADFGIATWEIGDPDGVTRCKIAKALVIF